MNSNSINQARPVSTSDVASSDRERQYTMPSITRERLTILVNLLDTLPSEVFDFSNWVSSKASSKLAITAVFDDEKGIDEVARLKGVSAEKLTMTPHSRIIGVVREGVTPLQMHSCGTAACALGWAATIPEFRAQGLNLIVNTRLLNIPFISGDVIYENLYGSCAGARFFNVSTEVAERFFIPDEESPTANVRDTDFVVLNNESTPKDVAARIREFLADPAAFAIKYDCDLFDVTL